MHISPGFILMVGFAGSGPCKCLDLRGNLKLSPRQSASP